ncbi:MAG TPA: iron export ABC transporter permease subunit FetB [Burkholderiales bacterium]|nr:iron export ABC transporter permease subunit FetB [Burkholderiales bacterium]
MNATYLELSWPSLAVAAALILINGAISIALRLGLERKLAIAALRTIVQLLLIGYILKWIFQVDRWYVVLAILALMTLIAGRAAAGRGAVRYHGMGLDAMLSVSASSWLITALGLFAVIHIDPWYRPQYAIPILGMILGNTLTGVSLGLERITDELSARRAQVETLLSLGASRWEAFRPSAQQAIRAGMMPVINAMTVVGLVSLPGMMTGQVLAGQAPEQAIRYQIVIMFLIAAASGLGTVSAVLLVYRRIFSRAHCFLYWRLEERKAGS